MHLLKKWTIPAFDVRHDELEGSLAWAQILWVETRVDWMSTSCHRVK